MRQSNRYGVWLATVLIVVAAFLFQPKIHMPLYAGVILAIALILFARRFHQAFPASRLISVDQKGRKLARRLFWIGLGLVPLSIAWLFGSLIYLDTYTPQIDTNVFFVPLVGMLLAAPVLMAFQFIIWISQMVGSMRKDEP
jgi:hypothetical protein